jgi:transcriptional regulator with XRE-family HTH domain
MRRLGLQPGDEIRRLRLDAGLSLTFLAERIDVDRCKALRIDAIGRVSS